MKWLNLTLGGIAGTLSRYILSGWVYNLFGTNFPYGTLVVNLLGCFLIGVLAVLAEEKFLLSPNARILLMAGFCGAFTTFSTFMLETGNFMRDGETLRALANILASVGLGFVCWRLGVLVGEIV